MRPDILSVLKNSNSRFIRDLLGKLTAFARIKTIYAVLFLPRFCPTSTSILIREFKIYDAKATTTPQIFHI